MTSVRSGMYHDEDQIVTEIRKLLEHGYHKDSFLREMMQNADDAKAGTLHLVFRPAGLGAVANNPLLNGPLLLIANTGELTASDEDALYRATGGNKAADEAKVGRFGLGLKSIFHWCETFIYCAVTEGKEPRVGVVNPYVRTDGHDPWNPSWQDARQDVVLLNESVRSLMVGGLGAGTGFLLCAPLRTKEHLNRADLRLHDWEWPEEGRAVPSLFDLNPLDGQSGKHRPLLPELVLVLAQCGHLDQVSAEWPGGGFTVARRGTPESAKLGRYKLAGESADLPNFTKELRSTIDVSVVGEGKWSVEVFGVDQTAPHGRELRQDRSWPKDMVPRRNEPGKSDERPRKALGHGAVTLVRWPSDHKLVPRVAVRWAAFLPLETAYHVAPQSSLASQHAAPAPLDIVLHGYFFPQPDRKGLEGLTTAGDSIASKWNRSVAREMTLPLVPAVLAAAAPQASPEARKLLDAAAKSLAGLGVDSDEVIAATALVPVIGASGTTYRSVDRADLGRYRSVLRWEGAARIPWFRRAVLDFSAAVNLGLVQDELVVSYFQPTALPWQSDEFVNFFAHLGSIQVLDQATTEEMVAVLAFVRQTFPRPADLGEPTAIAAAALRWLHGLQSKGWGPYGRKWSGSDVSSTAVQDLVGWLHACGALTVNVSRGAGPAVERLADERVRSVLLVPCGVQPGSRPAGRAVEACADLLPGLVARIADAEQPKKPATAIGPKAWKLLARDLVRLVGMARVCSDSTLKELALIPTWLPGRKRETLLSATTLAERAKSRLVFSALPDDDDVDAPASVSAALRDGAKALMSALASALAVSADTLSVVQVEGDNFASIDLDSVSDTLCTNARNLHGDFEQRQPLFATLCSDHQFSADRRRAVRLLAHGQASQLDSRDALYILPKAEPVRGAARAYLRQRHEDWRIVDGAVRRCTTDDDLEALGVVELPGSTLLDWLRAAPATVSADGFSDKERLALLHVVAASGDKPLFFALPLHAARKDARGSTTYSALAVGRTFRSGIEIPAEVATGVTIIADAGDGPVQKAYKDWLLEFDVRSLLDVVLMQDAPHEHWQLILTTLERPTGVLAPLAPAFAGLEGHLNEVEWLPNGAKGGVAPIDVVDDLACSDDFRQLLGEFLLESRARRPVLASALTVGDVGNMRVLIRQLNNHRAPLAALLDNLVRHAFQTAGRWALGPTSWPAPAPGFDALLGLGPLAAARIAWRLLLAARSDQAAGGVDAATLNGVAAALRGTMNAEDWVATLNSLVPLPNAPAVDAVREAWFELARLMPDAVILAVLPQLKLLCADGKWRAATHVSSSSVGVPDKNRAHDRVAAWLRLGEVPVVAPPLAEGDGTAAVVPAEEVAAFVEGLTAGLVQRPVLGAVFSLTGSRAMQAVAQGWLGDQDVVAMRAGLGVLPDPFGAIDHVRFLVSNSTTRQVRVPGVCGNHVVVDTDTEVVSLLEGDPRRYVEERQSSSTIAVRRPKIDVVLRKCDFAPLDLAGRKDVLRATAEALARAVLGSQRLRQTPFDQWWNRYGEGSQAAILPVRALLVEELPFKLEELRVRDVSALAGLNSIVKDIHNLRLARHDASGSKVVEADKGLRQRHQDLEDSLGDSSVAEALRQLVRKQLIKFGYSASSVLLELIQNADDALEQLAEMRQVPLPPKAREIQVQLHDSSANKSPLLTFTHWGRLINDHGGAGYPQGRAQQWDQDLYFMLRFQVSGKMGADAATEAVQSTGQFGLGFKSVHLVSDSPRIQSGDLAFCIDAGLLPREVKGQQSADGDSAIGTLMPTRIELPLLSGDDPKKFVSGVFDRLAPMAGLLPAMSRQVSSLNLPAEFGGVIDAGSNLVPYADGWTVTKATVRIGLERTQYKLLRFRPLIGRSIRTLVLGLVDGIPAQLPSDIPTFWVVAPTQETWELGYAVNGDFKLDTGRVRVAFDSAETADETQACGEAFGAALVNLVQAVLGSAAARDVLGAVDGAAFVAGLWRTLARGLDGRKSSSEEKVLLAFHGGERGLGRLSGALAAVPSGMPAPWPQLVGPIAQHGEVCVASNAALAPAVQPLFASLPELRGACAVVANSIAEPLKRTVQVRTVDFTVAAQLQSWSSKLHFEVTPEVADKLHPLAVDDCWNAIDAEVDGYPRSDSPLRAWAKDLKFRSVDGGMRCVSSLLLPAEARGKANDLSAKKSTFDDELLRCAFAPAHAVLSPEYAHLARRLDVFLRLRGELVADAADLAAWARKAPTTRAQHAACRYLAKGNLRDQVAKSIREAGPLQWAADRRSWQSLATSAGLTREESQQAEIALFGAISRLEPAPILVPAKPEPLGLAEARARLDQLWCLWSGTDYRIQRLSAQRKNLWPRTWQPEGPDLIGGWLRGNLASPDTRRAWLVLFLLAHVQGLGLKPEQHRGFAEFLLNRKSSRHRGSWFDRLFGDGAPDGTWVDFLDEWSRDRISGNRPWAFWMRVLPDMYAATKWWRVYAESLRAPRLTPPTRESMAPATDPDLAGDVESADVPAMAGAMNRHGWVVEELRFFEVIEHQPAGLHARDGYQPSPELTQLLHRLGYFSGGRDTRYTSQHVFDWLADLIGPEKADFHGLCATPLEIDAHLLLNP